MSMPRTRVQRTQAMRLHLHLRHPAHTRIHAQRRRQRGGALLVAMVMVLLVLMLAVTGMRSVTLESRIAGNLLESERFYQTADGTLRQGERAIQRNAVALTQCAEDTDSPVTDGAPCFVSEARTDTLGLKTSFATSAQAAGFKTPHGYWYPRYIGTLCPDSPTAGLDLATSGCTEFYEVNAQATNDDKEPQDCGPDALCLRSTVNLFIK